MIRIALAQINSTVGDLTGNQKKILDGMKQAKTKGVDLIVFPELSLCGYPPEDLLHKEHFVKDNIKMLRFLAKQAKDITAIIGFVDMDKNKNLYNAAAIIVDRKIKDVYYKQALPNYGVFDEMRYFQKGKAIKKFSVAGVTAAVNICEDIWVEEVCKAQVKSGAKLLINISSSPYDIGKHKAREWVLKTRAKQTKAFVAYANLVGGQDELVFDGGSMIVDPKGKIIAAAKEFEEDLLITDIDLGSKKKEDPIKAEVVKPSEKLDRIYKALVLGTGDYARKTGFEKTVIGLSGGIDSALVAAIAVDAMGADNVIGVTMPSRYTSEGTNSDAKKLAENLGIKLIELPIEGVFEAYLGALSGEFSGLEPNIAEENIQARIRGNFLMALSNKFGWLVLTTGNKSEVAVGYCTLYGDMSGGFAVIKDVPKTLVYELCRNINAQKGEVIPESIIDRPPSAELRADQKDQDSLPEYEDLDQMLAEYVEQHSSLAKMSKSQDPELIKKIIGLVDRNEYKRRQAPPGVKITSRAFGRDWRLPITNKYKEF